MMAQRIKDKEILQTVYEIEKKLNLTGTWSLQNEGIFVKSDNMKLNQMM